MLSVLSGFLVIQKGLQQVSAKNRWLEAEVSWVDWLEWRSGVCEAGLGFSRSLSRLLFLGNIRRQWGTSLVGTGWLLGRSVVGRLGGFDRILGSSGVGFDRIKVLIEGEHGEIQISRGETDALGSVPATWASRALVKDNFNLMGWR